MKPIEEAFSSAGFRGVVLPGVVLTIGLHPILAGFLRRFQTLYATSETVIVVAEVVIWGMLVSSTINSVYYIYEGFSWPWLTALARQLNERRLRQARAKYESILGGREYASLEPEEKVRAALVHEILTDFPLRTENAGPPERYVRQSTLLGNIIATYELYPRTRYGVDGVYFWFHLIALAPEAIAQEFREKYAFAESIVVTSFAGAVVAFLNGLALMGYIIGALKPSAVIANLVVSSREVFALMLFGIIVFVLFYLLALPAHRKAGRSFCAAVDLSISAFNKWSQETSAPLDTVSVERIADRKRYLNSLKPPQGQSSGKAVPELQSLSKEENGRS